MNLFRFGRISILTTALALAGFSASAATTNYAGLIYSGSPNTSAKSGIFAMSVPANQKFTGRMLIGNRGASFSGRFDTNGAADIVVKIIVDNSCYDCDPPSSDIDTTKLWDVHFQLSPGGDTLSGTVHFRHGGFPDGTLAGKRSSFSFANPVPAPGRFTFALSGSGDPANTNFPTGNGVGAIIVAPSGQVGFAGVLPDKLAFSLGTFLCDDGTFPVFDTLYNAKGMIQGWVGLTNSPDADVIGDVVWAKPNFAGRAFFPAGFTNDVPLVGSRYVQSKPLLNWTNGVVIFQGGKLSAPFTNNILLNAQGTVVNTSNNKLALKIQLSLGRFDGWANNPVTGDRIPFVGAVLQNKNGGLGFFPQGPLSGQVMLGPGGP